MGFFQKAIFRQYSATLFFFILVSLIGAKAHACPKQLKTDDIAANLLEQRMLVVGETHGTNEMPDYVGRLVCAQLQMGKKVILGLEYASSAQLALNAYLRSKGSKEDQSALYQELKFYSADGRGSQAMFRLIENMRKANIDGKQILLLGFANPLFPEPLMAGEKYKQNFGEAIMAEQIRYRSMIYHDYQFVILVGSYHAGKDRPSYYPDDWENMAYLLSRRMPIYTMGFSHNGGHAWLKNKEGKSGIGKVSETNEDQNTGFDSIYNLNGITASLPFIP